MRPEPLSTITADAADLQRRAWRVLLAAAGRSARGAPSDVPGFGDPDLEAPWLAWQDGAGYEPTTAAPPAVRPLLELYAPFCGCEASQPLTVAHLGQSLDGHIATGSGDSYYVTGPDNLLHLHRLRALCDVVIVGAGTVARDDPQLTVRRVEGLNPVRVILDRRGELGAHHRVFNDGQAKTLVVHGAGMLASAPGGAAALTVPQEDGWLRLDALLAQLHARGLWRVFIEGGGATVSSFLTADLLDRLHVTIAPLVTGSGRPGLSLPARDKIADCLRPQHRVFTMGGDVLFDCDLRAVGAPASAASGRLERAW